jgi:hypothetical protein
MTLFQKSVAQKLRPCDNHRSLIGSGRSLVSDFYRLAVHCRTPRRAGLLQLRKIALLEARRPSRPQQSRRIRWSSAQLFRVPFVTTGRGALAIDGNGSVGMRPVVARQVITRRNIPPIPLIIPRNGAATIRCNVNDTPPGLSGAGPTAHKDGSAWRSQRVDQHHLG